MNTILIFEPVVRGHIVEYLHHEYISASNDANRYIFVVSDEFKERSSTLTWPTASNIEIKYLSKDVQHKCTEGSRLKRAWHLSCVIRKYIIQYHADFLFLNYFVCAMPLLPFFLPKYCKVSGIVYSIYIWDKAYMSKITLWANRFLYYLYSRHRSVRSVLLLNDNDSISAYNSFFKTDRFKYIPDPAQDIDNNSLVDIRKDLGISHSDKVFLQLVVQKRKHITEIFDAIELCSKQELEDKVFVFAGSIRDGLQSYYYDKVKSLQKKVRIIDKTGFVPYDDLYNLFYISDYCFALYDNFNSSSGVVNNAARLDAAVITSQMGLLGSIVSKNHLGLCIEKIDAKHIREAILTDPQISTKDYNSTHTVVDFGKVFIKQFL